MPSVPYMGTPGMMGARHLLGLGLRSACMCSFALLTGTRQYNLGNETRDLRSRRDEICKRQRYDVTIRELSDSGTIFGPKETTERIR